MQPVIYDVAVSIDGYISGPEGDISKFAQDGPVVDDYMRRLAEYSVAVMGRSTYEFGYRFGLQPGENPYPHMETYVFSDRLSLPSDANVSVVGRGEIDKIRTWSSEADSSIYLVGGGIFASAVMQIGLVSLIRIKRAPVVLGSGVQLFEGLAQAPGLTHLTTRQYDDGYLFQEFRVSDD